MIIFSGSPREEEMRIGFDGKRLYNNFTGLGSYSRALVHDLHKYFPENEYFLYTPKVKLNKETEFFFRDPSFKTVLPGNSFNPFWRNVSLLRQLKSDRIQIYHGLSHDIPVNIHKSQIRSVVTIHDLIFKVYPHTYAWYDRYLYDIKFRYSCRQSDKIIAISESSRNDIVHYYNIDPEKIEVVYQTCNPLFYSDEDPVNETDVFKKHSLPQEYLLYVGSVIPRKNLITLIRSYEHLPSALRLPLVVVGNGGGYKKEVQQLTTRLGLDRLVMWLTDLKDNRELQVVYRKAMAMVYPSLYEGFGVPVVEALLSRTPVITSGRSSLPEAGGPGSYYLNDPENAEELAAGIIKVTSDSQLQKEMKETGWKYATNTFSPEEITRSIYGVYEKLLNGR